MLDMILFVILAPFYILFVILVWSTSPMIVILAGLILAYIIYRVETA